MIIDAGEMSDEEVVNAVEAALAAQLEIHPSELDVIYDPESGVVTYVITSDDIDSVAESIDLISDEGFIDSLEISDEIKIDSIEAPIDIIATVDVVVDASNIDDPNAAIASATESIQDQDSDYEIGAQGIILFRSVLDNNKIRKFSEDDNR